MPERRPTIAITPTLFVGPHPPDIEGPFIQVTTYTEAAEILIQRGMSEDKAWDRIRSVLHGTGYDEELFHPSPGQDLGGV